MSSPSAAVIPSETPSKKVEDSSVPSSTSDEGVKNGSPASIKTEQAAQQPAAVTNGALPESEAKTVGNGTAEPLTNGQDEKPAANDALHREVPALLPLPIPPLQPITTPSPTSTQPSSMGSSPSSSVTPTRQPPPPLLPMNATIAPVATVTIAPIVASTLPAVATKSAPPPPSPAAKAKARTAPPSAAPAVPKEQTPSSTLTSKPESAEQSPVQEEPKKRKIVAKKRHSVASSGNKFIPCSYFIPTVSINYLKFQIRLKKAMAILETMMLVASLSGPEPERNRFKVPSRTPASSESLKSQLQLRH